MLLPLPIGQFFQIHGSKFKLHPVCHLGQASVLCITHRVLYLFFCVGVGFDLQMLGGLASWGTNGSKTGKTLSVSSTDVDTKATFMVVVAL